MKKERTKGGPFSRWVRGVLLLSNEKVCVIDKRDGERLPGKQNVRYI